ncbi:protein UBASH3A homolog [Gigantopelta aegis]|uniref:protein UBASH3A homolog n=1 Tax=Gigantopelta aegis TaxID=1735272 RepID=UPI001B88C32C|nr:protein UBASH3A homolog [Gigantopelta aegis]
MAAAAPPRIGLHLHDFEDRQIEKSSLETLLQMGFSIQRAEKALAATGDRGIQLASDWLLSHVHDPLLDKSIPREYILYLCPVGAFQSEVAKFWDNSMSKCGWNGAHSYFPHITLCSFFKAEDTQVSFLTDCFTKLEARLNKAPGKLNLDFFTNPSFIGLFLSENSEHFRFLSETVLHFGKEVAPFGITVGLPKKQLHLTLAHQYPPEHHEELVSLAKQIDLSATCRWDMRLYSRDPRTRMCEVRKVVKAYPPKLGDELELIEGDYIFLEPDELKQSQDGWYRGTSWLTGSSGMFPGVFTQKTAETWTWTLHKSLPLVEQQVITNGSCDGDYDNLWNNDNMEDMYAKIVKKKKAKELTAEPRKPRQLFVMRHGERCDYVFGRKDWCSHAFDSSGNYRRINLNLPKTMLPRNVEEYRHDCPLTEIGKVQAYITGDGLKCGSVQISHVYSSPSLRCVQTAHEVVKGIGCSALIRVEPTLFEWLGWYKPNVPKWISVEKLASFGYNVDPSYTPFMDIRNLNTDESHQEYYARSSNFTNYMVRKHEEEGGNILIVAHAGNHDACTYKLCGKRVKSETQFQMDLCNVSFCAVVMIEEDPVSRRWAFKEPPVTPLCHGFNKLFNWKDV